MKVKVTKFRTTYTVQYRSGYTKVVLISFKLNSVVTMYEETIGATIKLLFLNTNDGN